jgi:hypothetical protein
MGDTGGTMTELIPILVALAPVVPGLVTQIIGLFHSTGGNPTPEDWEAFARRVISTPFDAPPTP